MEGGREQSKRKGRMDRAVIERGEEEGGREASDPIMSSSLSSNFQFSLSSSLTLGRVMFARDRTSRCRRGLHLSCEPNSPI